MSYKRKIGDNHRHINIFFIKNRLEFTLASR